MAAPKGNQYWRARTKHGRDKLFSTPDVLWDACVEYFDWVEANPLHEVQAFAYQGVVTQESVPKMRAMTITSLRLFLDVSAELWSRYKADKDFHEVITRAEEIIYSQKFAGAAAGLLNANIIARELGLADKSEHTGANGGAIQTQVTWTVQPVQSLNKISDEQDT